MWLQVLFIRVRSNERAAFSSCACLSGGLWAAQARRRSWLPRILHARSYLRGNWAAEDIMDMKMPKNRRVVEDVCHRLGNSRAEKMSAAQNLPRVKLFKRELGSRRHYGHENAQKQASCERNLSEIGQSPRNQTANSPKLEKMRYI